MITSVQGKGEERRGERFYGAPRRLHEKNPCNTYFAGKIGGKKEGSKLSGLPDSNYKQQLPRTSTRTVGVMATPPPYALQTKGGAKNKCAKSSQLLTPTVLIIAREHPLDKQNLANNKNRTTFKIGRSNKCTIG